MEEQWSRRYSKRTELVLRTWMQALRKHELLECIACLWPKHASLKINLKSSRWNENIAPSMKARKMKLVPLYLIEASCSGTELRNTKGRQAVRHGVFDTRYWKAARNYVRHWKEIIKQPKELQVLPRQAICWLLRMYSEQVRSASNHTLSEEENKSRTSSGFSDDVGTSV